MLRFICAAVACFAFACGGSSSPQTVFNATLNGANETPAVTTTATGTAKFTLNGSTITWTASTTPLSARYTVSHIHLDTSPGTRGPVVVTLTSGLTQAQDNSTSGGGSFTAPDATAKNADGTPMTFDSLVAAMRAGQTYFNVHTTANQNGEVRGQLGP